MNFKLIAVLAILAVILLTAALIYTVLYYMRREGRLLGRIQKMLDEAIEGTFQDRYLDESGISAVENSMWRYLCDNQTAYRALYEEKEQIQKLVSDISHQTVTPITNITLYSQLLEEELASGERRGDDDCRPERTEEGISRRRQSEQAAELAAIREQLEKLDFLVEALMKLSRLETGIIKVTPRKQEVQPVLEAVRRQFEANAARKEIQLKVEPTDEIAVFDQKWTIEALANVVDNAIKYTPQGGTVAVSVEKYPFFTRIDVADDGIGIPETEQAEIFTRFYRSKDVSEKAGLGIGLYLAREVMKAQNGYMKLRSEVGSGSVFSLFLWKEEMSQN